MVNNALKVDVELNILNSDKITEAADKALRNAQGTKSREGNDDRGNMERFYDMTRELSNKFRGIYTGDDKGIAAGINLARDASKDSGKVADDLMKIMKTSLGIMEDIHNRIKQASPLLQSVESLFNLAVQLFFMPLGNKLATVMLPAIMDLVEDVMKMWDKIEGMDLGEMLTAMIDYGVKAFGNYFINLGEQLQKEEGLISTLGDIMVALGDFVKNHLADLLNIGVNVLKWILENLGTLIDAFIEFKILSISLQMAQVGAAIGGAFGPIGSAIGAGIGLGAGEVGGHYIKNESGVQDMVNAMPRSWTGSYVGATEGGRRVIVGDGGEGEFILPEGRLQSMMDSIGDRMVDVAQAQPAQTQAQGQQPVVNNYYYSFNGYTDNDILDIIRREVSDQVMYSRLRSGF